MAKIDIREIRIRRMESELIDHGVVLPGIVQQPNRTLNEPTQAGPEVHHWIAQESDGRIAVYLSEMQRTRSNDPAVHASTLIMTGRI